LQAGGTGGTAVNGPPPEQSSYNSWASLPAGAQGEAGVGGNYFEGLIPPFQMPFLGAFAQGNSGEEGANGGADAAGRGSASWGAAVGSPRDGDMLDEDDGLVGQVCLLSA